VSELLNAAQLKDIKKIAGKSVIFPAISAVVAVNVTGNVDDEGALVVKIKDGVVTSLTINRDETDNAVVSLTLSVGDANKVLAQEVSAEVLFMQGRMKTAGDEGQLLNLLGALRTSEFNSFISEVRSRP